jgi:hypothetical protein
VGLSACWDRRCWDRLSNLRVVEQNHKNQTKEQRPPAGGARPTMFRWHSTVVEPSQFASCTTSAASATSMPSDATESANDRIIRSAYRDMVDAGRDLERDAAGKIKSPAALLRAVEAAGVRLGPPGAGTLIAMADRVPIRPPSFEEFTRCIGMEGSVVTGPAAPAAPGRGRGRGLAHLCSAASSSSASGAARGRGRGGAPAAAARGRGARGGGLTASATGRGLGSSLGCGASLPASQRSASGRMR